TVPAASFDEGFYKVALICVFEARLHRATLQKPHRYAKLPRAFEKLIDKPPIEGIIRMQDPYAGNSGAPPVAGSELHGHDTIALTEWGKWCCQGIQRAVILRS